MPAIVILCIICAAAFVGMLALLLFLPPDDKQIGCRRIDFDEMRREEEEDEAMAIANS